MYKDVKQNIAILAVSLAGASMSGVQLYAQDIQPNTPANVKLLDDLLAKSESDLATKDTLLEIMTRLEGILIVLKENKNSNNPDLAEKTLYAFTELTKKVATLNDTIIQKSKENDTAQSSSLINKSKVPPNSVDSKTLILNAFALGFIVYLVYTLTTDFLKHRALIANIQKSAQNTFKDMEKGRVYEFKSLRQAIRSDLMRINLHMIETLLQRLGPFSNLLPNYEEYHKLIQGLESFKTFLVSYGTTPLDPNRSRYDLIHDKELELQGRIAKFDQSIEKGVSAALSRLDINSRVAAKELEIARSNAIEQQEIAKQKLAEVEARLIEVKRIQESNTHSTNTLKSDRAALEQTQLSVQQRESKVDIKLTELQRKIQELKELEELLELGHEAVLEWMHQQPDRFIELAARFINGTKSYIDASISDTNK